MYIILGATGHVGSGVAEALLNKGQEITVITRDSKKAAQWERKGAKAEVVDIHDVAAFTKVLQKGTRLFLLNPPAATERDAVREEKHTVAALLKALADSPIEKVVAESTYGAQAGNGIGDLGVLYEMEEGLWKIRKPTTVLRASYYMSNWDSALDSVLSEGKLYSFLPANFRLPMVAPSDIGEIAANLLMEPISESGIQHVEGPTLYSPWEVAETFSAVLDKPVEVVSIPQEQWVESMKQIGFSDTTAQSYAKMTKLTVEQEYTPSTEPLRGSTTIKDYVEKLCQEKEVLLRA